MRFEEIPGKGNVDIAFYNVVDIEAKTVGGLLQLIFRNGGFGDIELWKMPNQYLTTTHYKQGAPIEIPADLAKLSIQNVTASGGWGRTDYKIFV